MSAFMVAWMTFVALLALALGSAVDDRKPNTVFVAILIRNKAHTLPYFFSALESLDYPKDRMHLWIRSDHNIDNSITILNKWLETSGTVYHSVDVKVDNNSTKYDDESGPAHWPHSRFQHIVQLKESALRTARESWSDYIWFLDCDAFIINKSTLRHLIKKKYPVVAPMLKSDGLYSNFWCGMTENYYYKRTSDYAPIVEWKTKGCYQVPMIHSSVLIDLRLQITNYLTFNHSLLSNYMGPVDDIIIFAMSANFSGIPLHICNDEMYGFITIPLEKDSSLEMDISQLTNIKLEITVDNEPLQISSNLSDLDLPSALLDNMGLDNVFVINLARRTERRNRMHYCLNELGLNATFIEATDGRALTETDLEFMGVRLMPGYKDPYYKRPITKGEIGCFMSHYRIWAKTTYEGLNEVLVLEDDARFEPYFRFKLQMVLNELRRLKISWDLVYIGRKSLNDNNESWLENSKLLVRPGYSYWTLGYLLSGRGAKKLLNANPLKKLLPVDEFLPIMFNQHPRTEWLEQFEERNLIALSASPLLIYPIRYTSDDGYVSDTEDSVIVQVTNDNLATEQKEIKEDL
ncbi:glycosyltransferase 25 family member [Aphis gossypii]|uniref:glycosyltransferase 25 family member n=1 Tax=Aphis gossypii TaxID=80765 RepID=UPI002158B849|nr:glycosyltransferase 25 family member [Aphis gossypii]